MRSYSVHGVDYEGTEVYVTTVYSAQEGIAAHADLLNSPYARMRVYDCLGGVAIDRDLVSDRESATVGG